MNIPEHWTAYDIAEWQPEFDMIFLINMFSVGEANSSARWALAIAPIVWSMIEYDALYSDK